MIIRESVLSEMLHLLKNNTSQYFEIVTYPLCY